MNTSELFLRSALADQSFNTTLSKIELSKAEPNFVKPQIGIKPDGTLFLVPLCFLIIWAVIVFMASGIWKVARDEKVKTVNSSQIITILNVL